MADLFDIANLITSVGVDAVKIKPEPGLPEKSSNEILTELFSTFDANEGTVSPQEDDEVGVKTEKLEKPASVKKKKSKKKHKHKDKKHKKKSKHNTSDSESNDGNSVTKKKKKHKKKSKRKHDSSKSSDSDEPSAKIPKAKENDAEKKDVQNNFDGFDDFDIVSRHAILEQQEGKLSVIKQEPGSECLEKNEKKGSDSPCLPPIIRKDEEDPDVPISSKLLERPKQSIQGKILIKDLKNSAAYNEAIKEAENKEKEKALRMEDGELTDSSEDNRTPTLSPSPSEDPSRLSPIGKRILSPNRGTVTVKNDLRLVLKEKEKMRLKSRAHHSRKDDKSSKSKNSKRSRSCQSNDGKRSESRLRSHRSRSKDTKRKGRSRDRHERGRSHDKRESERSRDRRRHRNRSDDRNWDRHSRGRSRSRERKERIEIDKKKLLEIARRNAINMIKQGTLPLAQQDKAIAAIQAGGKTVDELTDFCKSLSKSEALGELSSISSDDDGSGSEKGFHHPFLLKERPSSIIMNIRDAKQLPTKTFQEKTAESSNQLRLQFPVSSGQLHRKTESEWVPVAPKKPEPKKQFVPASAPEPFSIAAPPTPVPPPIVAAPVQPQQQQQQQQQIPQQATTIFPLSASTETVDIGSIVSQRLAAMRKLRENPHDVVALNEMYRAQNEMKTWAESKQMPGQFTGSTGAKLLSPAELTAGFQAWARKDQLVSAQPVSGGMGMALLQKMGWRPGEGLGKNKEGTLEPLQLEVKLDKRGLVSEQDIGQKPGKTIKPVVPTIKTLEGKHPVSLLGEYCSKRKLGAPVYELCFECGPDHKKNFLFKVKVNGIEYKPSVASPNKKQAKAEAAQICLQTLGLLPSKTVVRDPSFPPSNEDATPLTL